jgi:hypothetical protein
MEMAKNIVILSDGTGQGASMPKAERTNVWKRWDATKKVDRAQQVTFYDEGLGAEHKREWWRWAYDLASRATGLGISQNIKDCYTALIEYYEPGDRVFLFGFSRGGAFTVRSLGGVLSLCGIPQHDAAGNSPHDRQNKKGRLALVEEAVEKVYKHYGGNQKEKERIALGVGISRSLPQLFHRRVHSDIGGGYPETGRWPSERVARHDAKRRLHLSPEPLARARYPRLR